jgi:hypothetical protein
MASSFPESQKGYVSVSDGIPPHSEMSQHWRACRCFGEEAALRFRPLLPKGESVLRGRAAIEMA